VNLNTANAILTNSGSATVYIPNPGPNLFPNLNPVGGLAVTAGTLRIGNITNANYITNITTMTGTGILQFDLAGTATNTFFTNAATTICNGNAGNRAITAVNSFSDATGSNPQILTNNSTGYLDIQLDGTSPSATMTATSFGGIGSVTGKNGAIYLEQFHGSNNLGTASINTTDTNNQVYLFGPNNNHLATTIVSGGNINLCQQGPNYDVNTAVWTVSGGTQGVANGKGIYMSVFSGGVSTGPRLIRF
jgi:hypothetical protein